MEKQENLTENNKSSSITLKGINYWKYISLILAILFVGSLIATYFFYINSSKTQTSVKETSTLTSNTKIPEAKVPIENTNYPSLDINKLGSYTKTRQTVNYKCYEEASTSEDKEFTELKQEVAKDNRAISQACVYQDKAIVASIKKVREMWNEPYGMQLHVYTKTEDNWYYGEALFTSTDEEMFRFKLIDWTTNNDIVYAMFDGKMKGVRIYPTGVFHYNLSKEFENPQLIESCEYGIAGGTSARGFNKCVSFSSKENSSFIKQSDLP